MTDWTPTDSGLFLRNAAPNATGADPVLAAMRRFSILTSLLDGDDDSISISSTEEIINIGTGTTTTGLNTSLLPANSIILAVAGIVLVTIPTATSLTFGTAAQPAKFATGVSPTAGAGSKFVGTLHWNPAVASDALGPRNVTAAAIVIDPQGTNPATATGFVRVRVYALEFKAPAL